MRGIIFGAVTLVLGALLLFNGCSSDPIAGGTSTSENGRVVGCIVDGYGTPVADAQVILLSVDFDPVRNHDTLPVDTTDLSGNYSFSSIVSGEYSLQSVHLTNRTRGSRTGISVDKDTVTVPDDTLRNPGSIRVAIPEGVDTASGYIYLQGTTIYSKMSGTGVFAVLDSVPAGHEYNVAYASGDTAQPAIWNSTVEVRPEDTVTVAATGWKYSRQLWFNTTASGAAVDGAVYNFPVLIRLQGGDFNFTQANNDGSDLIFVKQNGAVLPSEVERWDVVNKVAEVWLSVDTIPGGDSTGTVTMYWGNSRVKPAPGRRAVFDTAAGFAAVWHMGENADTVYDVTPDRYHGLRTGELERFEGIIGGAQRFDSSRGYCDMGNVLNPGTGSFTASAWVKKAGAGLQTIFAKSKGGSPNAAYGWSVSLAHSGRLQLFVASGGDSWGARGAFDLSSKEEHYLTDTTSWHFIAVVVDRADSRRCRLYLDGVNVTDSINGDLGAVESLGNSVPFRIGAEADGDYPWAGTIDECVVADVARTEAWIRLCYLNQGPVNRLVVFR